MVDEGEKFSVVDGFKFMIRLIFDVDFIIYWFDVCKGIWYVFEVDLEFILMGCGVFGIGGGGFIYYEFLKSFYVLWISDKGRMCIILFLLFKDIDMVCFGLWYGSFSVINECIVGGNEIVFGIEVMGRIVGCEKFDVMFIDEM